MSTVYRKVLYREYTDSTFRTLKPRPPEWEHLGFLGPVIHAVVGDTIRVVFRNNGHRPYSIHPHGVFYEKSSEGVPYNDGASDGRTGNGVPPGGTYVYVWPVPERAGPGPMDGSSVMWMYHSHVDEVRDINTGLFGPMIVTARGMARPDGSPKDVDREIVAAFTQVEENFSWLADENHAAAPTRAMRAARPIPNPSETDAGYPWFVKFTINGFIHGSMPLAGAHAAEGRSASAGTSCPRPTISTFTRRTGTATTSSSVGCAPTCSRSRSWGWRPPTWCPTTRHLAVPLPRLVPQLGGHGGAVPGDVLRGLARPPHAATT